MALVPPNSPPVIQVQLPTPVTQKPKPQVVQQPPQPVPPQPPRLNAVILPWTPGPKRMGRGGEPKKYAAPISFVQPGETAHEALNRYLSRGRNRNERRYGRSSVIRRVGDDIHVVLHGTHVVVAHPNGQVTMNHGGYMTPTTRRFIAGFAGPHVRNVSFAGGKFSILNRDGQWVQYTPGTKYPLEQKAESGELTPEQYHLLHTAIESGENTPLGALGDNLAESGFPISGSVLSRASEGHPQSGWGITQGHGERGKSYFNHYDNGNSHRVVFNLPSGEHLTVYHRGDPSIPKKMRRLPKRVIRFAKSIEELLARGHLLPQEQERVRRTNKATQQKILEHLQPALRDHPGTMPGLGEITSLAQLGAPAKGGYTTQYDVMNHLLHEPGDADRWVTINSIFSGNSPWESHTADATEAMAKWHAAGRPTDPRGLAKVFGTVKLVNGSWIWDKSGTFKGKNSAYGSKGPAVINYLASGGGPIQWENISKESFKTPNFGLAFVDPRGTALDTHMARLLTPGHPFEKSGLYKLGRGVGMTPEVMDQLKTARDRLVNTPHAYIAYKTLISHAAEQLGWEPRQVQEAVWTSLLGVMALKHHDEAVMKRPTAKSIMDALTKQAIAAGWDLEGVLRSPEIDSSLKLYGVKPGRLRDVLTELRRRRPEEISVSNPAALESVARRLIPEVPPAGRPIYRVISGKTTMARLPKRRFSTHSADLISLLKAARENPNEATIHGAIADKLEEDHGENPVSWLIRRQFGLGEHGGKGPRENVHYPESYRGWYRSEGEPEFRYSVPLNESTGFTLSLVHENGDRWHGPRLPPRWVIHATRHLIDPKEEWNRIGYTFEFPHEEAHLIPRMFPGAGEYINPEKYPEFHHTYTDMGPLYRLPDGDWTPTPRLAERYGGDRWASNEEGMPMEEWGGQFTPMEGRYIPPEEATNEDHRDQEAEDFDELMNQREQNR